MKKLLATCAFAILTASYSGIVLAQPAQPADNSAAAKSDLSGATGQTVFDSQGRSVGKISAVGNDSKGQQVAIVSAGQYLGLGSKDVLIPASSLQSKADGSGFITTMSQDDIQALPEYKSGKSDAMPSGGEAK